MGTGNSVRVAARATPMDTALIVGWRPLTQKSACYTAEDTGYHIHAVAGRILW